MTGPVGTRVASAQPTDPSLRDAADVARAQGVDPRVGLSDGEAARRLVADGPNVLRAKPPVPLWRKLLDQFRDPLVYLLLVAVIVSVLAWAAEGAAGVPVDAVVISAVVVANAAIGFIQEHRAENAVAALQAVTAARSTVLRDGSLRSVASSDLVRGDVMVLAEGDAVGADGRLLTASALCVSEAELTGESEPVTKDCAALVAPSALGDRTDMVYRGTCVTRGVGRAVVTSTGMGTEMGAIADMLDHTDEQPSPLEREIAWLGRMLGVTVIAIAVVVMTVTTLTNHVDTATGFVTVLLLGVSLAVAAVPEGLPAIVTVVLSVGMQRMARHHAVVKDLHSVETLGTASVIASDKTGTLTKNEMTIRRIRTTSGELELTGAGYRTEGVALAGGVAPTDPDLVHEAMLVLGGGSLANDAELQSHGDEWAIQGDPTEAAFLVAAHKLDGTTDALARFDRRSETPFTSERKMMSVVVERIDDGRVFLIAKGAPDVLLRRCSARQVGRHVVPLDDASRASALADVETLSASAFRTLAVAYRRVEDDTSAADEDDLVYVGVVGMIDPPRDEVPDAVRQARTAGLRVVMVTGDHPTTAVRIASELGIAEPGEKALTATELDRSSPAQLRTLAATAVVYARVAPRNKLQIVEALRAHGEVVAVTGDGVNDAPALKAADVGVAMGTGTEVTKEAAKVILGDDNFATIVAAVRQGRVIFDNIRKFLRYLLSSNMGEVFTVFFGIVCAGSIGITGGGGDEVVVPLLATQILWINLVTDAAPALAMGMDPEIEDVMARPPRRTTDRIIDRRMWTGILLIGLVMAAATLFTFDIFLPGGLIHGSDSLEVARTAGFTTLVFAQLFNAFSSRSDTVSVFRYPFTNGWLWTAVAMGALMQIAVVHTPFLQTAFGTAPLDAAHWAMAVGMASLVLWFDEARKLLMRRAAGPTRGETGPAPSRHDERPSPAGLPSLSRKRRPVVGSKRHVHHNL